MKKKTMCAVMVMVAGCLITTPVKANVLDDISTYVVTAKNAIVEAYEGSVIARTVGRAGASTENGAKGIVHEVMFMDRENAKTIFRQNTITDLTKSSTATQVDVVTMEDGAVAARYQLKDTPNSIRNTVKQVESGKYRQAQMVGTKETVKAYEKAVSGTGITKEMKSSGISTETTSRIAQKGIAPFSKKAMLGSIKQMGKGSAVGAIVNGGIALGESIYNGDNFGEATGNVAMSTVEGAAAGAATVAAGEIATAALAAAGVTGAATVALPATIAVGAGIGISYGVTKLDEKYDLKGKIADATNGAKEALTEKYEEAKPVVEEKLSRVKESFSNAADAASEFLSTKTEEAKESFTTGWENIKASVSAEFAK